MVDALDYLAKGTSSNLFDGLIPECQMVSFYHFVKAFRGVKSKIVLANARTSVSAEKLLIRAH